MKKLVFITLTIFILLLAASVYAAEETKTDSVIVTQDAILLNPHFDNLLKIGESAWYTEEENAGSTGYTWQAYIDNSGVYELVKIVKAYPQVKATGAPGRVAWEFKMIKEGIGNIKFDLLPPGKKEPETTIVVKLEVKK